MRYTKLENGKYQLTEQGKYRIKGMMAVTAIVSAALTLFWTVIAVDGKCSFMNAWAWLVISTIAMMTIIMKGDDK